jgi:hypothetical protein
VEPETETRATGQGIEEIGETMEKLWIWMAWRMPKELVRWCGVRIGANATTGEHSRQDVPELSFLDAMRRW